MGEISDEQLWSWVDRGAAELDEHLARHPEDAARVAELRAAIGGVAAAETHEALPERIGGYEVVRRLGEGGMGIVYEAVQASPRRPVALKVIRGGSGADEQRVRLFRREAEALARLNHPGIATIYEAGTTPQGEHFFAMELVAGEPLHRWARERRPKRRVVLELFRRICEAVHYAHTQGVVHRDIKPSNVIVGEDGRPKVLDFGLARVAGGAGSLATRATLGGALLGTLQYMSPEQASGTSGAVDAASDVYSLGVVLFELLTGELPHELDELPLLDAARAIRELPPRAPSALDRSLRGDLETIVLKALEKRPRDRYLSAAELAADVERFLVGLPINARRPSPGKRALRFVLRHKVGTVAALLAVALLLVAFLPRRGGGIDLERDYPGRGFAELSPFEDLRWKAWRPEVRVGGRWYELLAIEGVNTGLVLEYCKQTEPDAWIKRFTEDLVDVLDGLGIDAGRAADLEVRDLETDRRLLLFDVPMTSDNRRRLRDARHKSAWDDLEWKGASPHVLVGGTWSELLAVDGRPLAELRALAERMLGLASARAFLAEQVDLLTLASGDTPGRTVRLDLRDPDGTVRSVDAPFTVDLYRHVRPRSGAPFSRTPFEAVRWPRPDRPQVLVGERWYAPIALDGRAFADVVAVARDAYPTNHEKRLSEDLEVVLEYMGLRLGDTVDLVLADVETGEPVERPGVPATAAKRESCRRFNRELE